MGKVAPPGDRAIINDQAEGLEVVIPSRKNWFIILFLGFWLCGWFMGETTVIYALVTGTGQAKDGTAFLLVWLAGWTIGGVFAGLLWLWNVSGKERLTFTSEAIRIRREVVGLGYTKEYDLGHASRLRVSVEPMNFMQMRGGLRFWGFGGGLIAFDYGSSTVRMGSSLEEAEAQRLVDRVGSRLSRLR